MYTINKKAEISERNFYKWARKAKAAAEAWLKKTLKKNNNEIVFDTEYDDEYTTVVYDGGNHPEYASNAFSQVYKVYLDGKGNIMLEVEETSYYDIDNINVFDLLAVCDAVKAHLENDHE